MTRPNTNHASNGEALRRLGQIALDFYEASSHVWDARHMLEKANARWLASNQQTAPERGTPEWTCMTQATATEYEHLQRMKTRRSYVQDRLLKRAAAALGIDTRRRNAPEAGVVPKKLALLDLQQKLADPKQQRALDKRRLCAALSDAGVSRSVALQICRDYFGPPLAASETE
ncbi:hypothetical protein [Delftia tsuruhatensis]|uniref:hypothetical protein n=2 Tax=Pseudomonadota TaxID=1224 RepID=UPI00289B07EB|nr:hypothetical protein [Delftia tsuruhatensis]